MRAAALQMATLNAAAAEAMNAVGANACTDVTGFGLVGHGRNIALASDVTLRYRMAEVPIFPGAYDLAAKGIVSGGTARGKMALGQVVSVGNGVDEHLVNIAFDAETSGGLLISLPAERGADLERELTARDVPVHCIGEVVAHTGKLIELV